MATCRWRSSSNSRRRLGFEALEERRVLSVSVELASKAAWSPLGANGDSSAAVFSDDGRYVFFNSDATDLVAGLYVSDHYSSNIFRLDRDTEEIELATFAGAQHVTANGTCHLIDTSADGNWIVFRSDATNLDPADESDEWNFYLRDLSSGTTWNLNRDLSEAPGSN
jgi:Tol biopolymer transport system component